MRQKKVTYLLGAGASANCLPLVPEFNRKLNDFKELLKGHLQDLDTILIAPKKFDNSQVIIIGNQVVEDIDWLLDEMQNHFTIDTLAKRFYLTRENHDSLLRLKKVLYTYFLYEQGIKFEKIRGNVNKELPDRRYDSFIATLISNEIDKLELPANVNIITWNYDIQFELAYQVYDKSGIYVIQDKLNVFPDFNKQRKFIENVFSIVHLNGVIYPVPQWKKCENLNGELIVDFDSRIKEYLERMCYTYNSLTNDYIKRLNFSWEDPDRYDMTDQSRLSCIDIAKKIMQQTDILIVVGYSFPLFNRRIDSDILSNLRGSIDGIYIQDVPEQVDNLVDLFINSFSSKINLVKGSLENIVKPVPYVNQFYYPPDLI